MSDSCDRLWISKRKEEHTLIFLEIINIWLSAAVLTLLLKYLYKEKKASE